MQENNTTSPERGYRLRRFEERTRYSRSVNPPSLSNDCASAEIWRSGNAQATAMGVSAAFAAISGRVDEVDLVNVVDSTFSLRQPRRFLLLKVTITTIILLLSPESKTTPCTGTP